MENLVPTLITVIAIGLIYAVAGAIIWRTPTAVIEQEAVAARNADPTTLKGGAIRTIKTVIVMLCLLTVMYFIGKWVGDLFRTLIFFAATTSVYSSTGKAIKALRPRTGTAATLAVSTVAVGLIVLPAFLFPNWMTIDLCAAVMGIAFLSAIRSVGLRTCVALLVGIACYDAIAVFGTPMMLGMAKTAMTHGKEIPILFMIPKALAKGSQMKLMFGLGDVLLPGLAIMIGVREAKRRGEPSLWIGPLVGYALGFALTCLMMVVFHAAQPATIYLVPSTLAGLVIAAHRRGVLGAVWRGTPPPPKTSSPRAE